MSKRYCREQKRFRRLLRELSDPENVKKIRGEAWNDHQLTQGRSADVFIIDDPAADPTQEQQERMEKWYHDLPRLNAQRREVKKNMEWLRALRIPIPSELADHIPGFIKEPMTMDEVHASLGGFSRKRSTENDTVKDGIISRLREITATKTQQIRTLQDRLDRTRKRMEEAMRLCEAAQKRNAELMEEVTVDDQLLRQLEELLKAVPECPTHGRCIPHAIEWVNLAKTELNIKSDKP
jgi:hypothetical protein